MRNRLRKFAPGIAAIVVLALGAAALANATVGGGDDQPLSGITAERASAAALKAVGGGKVIETELDDENGATYEVEVRKTDGSSVDVRLDESFAVVVIEGDTEEPDTDDADD
jgi:ABC-type transporter Mla subunit MlaD